MRDDYLMSPIVPMNQNLEQPLTAMMPSFRDCVYYSEFCYSLVQLCCISSSWVKKLFLGHCRLFDGATPSNGLFLLLTPQHGRVEEGGQEDRPDQDNEHSLAWRIPYS